MRLIQFTGIDVIHIYNCLDPCKVICVAVGINNTCTYIHIIELGFPNNVDIYIHFYMYTCDGSESQRFVNQS